VNLVGREGGPIVSGPLRLSPPLVPRRVFAGLTAIRISFAEFIFITNKLFSPPSGFEPAGTCRPVTSPCIIRLIGDAPAKKLFRVPRASARRSIEPASGSDGHFCRPLAERGLKVASRLAIMIVFAPALSPRVARMPDLVCARMLRPWTLELLGPYGRGKTTRFLEN